LKKDPAGSFIFSYHEATSGERKLEEALKKERLPYEREVPVKEFTVDFLVDGWLIVEVDGESHVPKDRVKRDLERQKVLEAAGFTVLRIPAMEVSRPEGAKRWVRRIKKVVGAGPPGLSRDTFENRDWKDKVEKARQELIEKALRAGQMAREERAKLVYGRIRSRREAPETSRHAEENPSESMDDYFGKKGEDFEALLSQYGLKKVPDKDASPDVDGLARKKRRK